MIIKSGFYRIWIEWGDKEFSYIGISKNIEGRIKTHLQKIKSFYQLTNFEKVFLPRLYSQLTNPDELLIPSIGAFYWKATFFLYQHNKKLEDFRWEILKEKEINVLTDQFEEMKFIEKFNSEKLGFNGPFAKAFQIQNMLNFEIDESKQTVLKNLFDLQEKKNSLLIKELENTKEVSNYLDNFMPWLGFQMEVKKWQGIYLGACESIFLFGGSEIDKDKSFDKAVETRLGEIGVKDLRYFRKHFFLNKSKEKEIEEIKNKKHICSSCCPVKKDKNKKWDEMGENVNLFFTIAGILFAIGIFIIFIVVLLAYFGAFTNKF